MDNNDASDDFMKEIRKAELQDEILADAFYNSYRLLIKAISFDEMIEDKYRNDLDAVLAFDPELGPALSELENMIDFYIQEEDYEKCANLRDIMHIKFPQSISLGQLCGAIITSLCPGGGEFFRALSCRGSVRLRLCSRL